MKFNCLKNEKGFWSEIKTFFLASQILSFRHTKQTSKNVSDTTFKYIKKGIKACTRVMVQSLGIAVSIKRNISGTDFEEKGK